tara:strand:- start:3326 stop:4168 length:843 start_codon:yes stop_codon:yes gene_type:complete
MKKFQALIIIFCLTSCEEIIYGKYRIIKKIPQKRQTQYIVKKGENLFIISERFNISLNNLIKINNINSPYKIFPNQKLRIPQNLVHRIKKGDTLYSISRKYKVNRSKLYELNKIKPDQKIFVGDSLIIPIEEGSESIGFENIEKKKPRKKEIFSNSRPSFIWPTKGEIILEFGKIKSGFHNDGINIKSEENSPVMASEGGEIIYTGNEIPGYGNLILIKHQNNWVTAYSHLKHIIYKKGYVVSKGEKIGLIGKTGNVNQPQLHFEIRKGKKALNPSNFLS